MYDVFVIVGLRISLLFILFEVSVVCDYVGCLGDGVCYVGLVIWVVVG